MKRIFLFLSLLVIVSLSCDINVTIPSSPSTTPSPTGAGTLITETPPISPSSIPETPAVTFLPLPSSFEGTGIAVDPLNIVLSPAIASGARGIQVPRVEGEDAGPWGVTPGHIQLKLEGYILQDRFHQPQIYVYPAQAYAEMYPRAFESMHRLNNIFGVPSAQIGPEQLPAVPFFNAQQLFASNIQPILFQNGKGVRFLTEYAQYLAPANNHDLFYHFQGLTDDGAYYIVAILPIRHPALAEISDAGADLPSGGIPLPNLGDPNADWPGYYVAVNTLLGTSPQDVFTPRLEQLDQLIQSMRVIPQ